MAVGLGTKKADLASNRHIFANPDKFRLSAKRIGLPSTRRLSQAQRCRREWNSAPSCEQREITARILTFDPFALRACFHHFPQ